MAALFAFNMPPVEFAGAGLALLGNALRAAEAFIGAFRVLGLGGIAAFVIGSILRFYGAPSGFVVSVSVVIAAAIVSANFFFLALAMVIRSSR